MRHMRMVNLFEVTAEIEFAKQAAKVFAENPAFYSYGEIKPGAFIALRWGLGDDCVLVLKLDESFEPTNYQQLVREHRRKEEGDGETKGSPGKAGAGGGEEEETERQTNRT